MQRENLIILGAAGRDFHNFNELYKNNKKYNVVAFTATQIPGIEERKYPKELAGKLYPKGIPIYDEKNLEKLIKKLRVESCVFSYSDVSYKDIGNLIARCNSAGATFMLLPPKKTMIKSKKKVIAVCAVRTGSGKSQTTRYIARMLQDLGKKVVVVRHPMPYGNLKKQAVQRFTSYADLERHECTIEEREEYEPLIRENILLYAGVDYKRILKKAEKEAEIIIWDGGNNDTPFYKPDLWITVMDPLRAGHELSYYPGETNFRMADILLINKVNSATKQQMNALLKNIKQFNPKAEIVLADSILSSDKNISIKNKKVIVVEDGPTVTHGGMNLGAGFVFSKKKKAKIINPRPYAVRSLKTTFEKYAHLSNVLPAMGYSKKQIADLKASINKAKADIVVSGTPIDIERLMKVNTPVIQVRYNLKEKKKGRIKALLKKYKII